MRGKRGQERGRPGENRNIPAYAGKTKLLHQARFCITEHPRVCGENVQGFYHRHIPSGTSPRMRGKRTGFLPSTHTKRNIPAYAGKTITRVMNSSDKSEHPRVCGENTVFLRFSLRVTGTSPRMRGKPLFAQVKPLACRNIPAYAGKTLVYHSTHS